MFVLSNTISQYPSVFWVTSPWVSVCVSSLAQVSFCQQESDWLSAWGNLQEPVTLKQSLCHRTLLWLVRLISCVRGVRVKAVLTTGFIWFAGINDFLDCIMFATIKSHYNTISNLTTLSDFSNGKQQNRDKPKCDQYLSGHLRVTNIIVMGHLIYWYGRVETEDWDRRAGWWLCDSIPDVQIRPKSCSVDPHSFPIMQPQHHHNATADIPAHSHCSTIMQGEILNGRTF